MDEKIMQKLEQIDLQIDKELEQIDLQIEKEKKELGVCPFIRKPARIIDKENEQYKYNIEMGQKLLMKIFNL